MLHSAGRSWTDSCRVSESELEDLISLDDKVLDDIYQYHLPPTRRIPPLLWTRVRSDLPGYLSDAEADGVSVMSWYHRQFKDAAYERYFKCENDFKYFHGMMSDFFIGEYKKNNTSSMEQLMDEWSERLMDRHIS